MSRPTLGTPERKAVILQRLREGMTRAQAAASVGVRRETLWEWQKKDDEFANAIAEQVAMFGRELVGAMVDISRNEEHPKRMDAVKYLLESRFPEESPRVRQLVIDAMDEHDHRILSKIQGLDEETVEKVTNALAEARQDAMAGRPAPSKPEPKQRPSSPAH